MSKKKYEFSSYGSINDAKGVFIFLIVLGYLGVIGLLIVLLMSKQVLNPYYLGLGIGACIVGIVDLSIAWILVKAFIGGLYDAKAIRYMLEDKENETQPDETTKSKAYASEHTIIVFIDDKFTIIENGKIGFAGRVVKNADDTVVLITADSSQQMALSIQDNNLVSKSGTVYKKVASV